MPLRVYRISWRENEMLCVICDGFTEDSSEVLTKEEIDAIFSFRLCKKHEEEIKKLYGSVK